MVMNKQQLEQEVEKLKHQLQSTEGDCGILLKENIDLINKIKKLDKTFDDQNLFTAQWRAETEETEE